MSVLTNLKLVSVTKPRAIPSVVKRRNKLLMRLRQQREMAEASLNGQPYFATRLRSVKDPQSGFRSIKEMPVRVKGWWWTGDKGETLIAVRYGSKILEIAKGKTAIQLSAEADLPRTLDAVIAAVENGELDTQLQAVGSVLRANFKR